jgi:hypothetical protein
LNKIKSALLASTMVLGTSNVQAIDLSSFDKVIQDEGNIVNIIKDAKIVPKNKIFENVDGGQEYLDKELPSDTIRLNGNYKPNHKYSIAEDAKVTERKSYGGVILPQNGNVISFEDLSESVKNGFDGKVIVPEKTFSSDEKQQLKDLGFDGKIVEIKRKEKSSIVFSGEDMVKDNMEKMKALNEQSSVAMNKSKKNNI